jgi:toxin ParE1/3/4
MTVKPIVPRDLALRDVEDAIAVGFIDQLEATYGAISRRPATGSPRTGHALGLPGLRSRRLKRFPYLVFYVERADHIDLWRVLHASRDIPASLRDLDR